jgi:hypothetical protein
MKKRELLNPYEKVNEQGLIHNFNFKYFLLFLKCPKDLTYNFVLPDVLLSWVLLFPILNLR